jgi:CHAD domain-containing protein
MLPGVASGEVRAVHQTRVASRRLREVLPVLQLDSDTAQKLGRRLKKVTRQLGRLRELDVLPALADELSQSDAQFNRALQFVIQDIRRSREQVRQRLEGKDVSAKLAKLGHKLKSVAKRMPDRSENGHGGRSWQWAIDARAARRAATLEQAIDEAGAVYLPERLHGVRVALKKLRYAVELSAESQGLKTHDDLRTLRRGQDLLGRLHDLQVLAAYVLKSRAAAVPTDLRLADQLDELQMTLDNTCRRLHARYMKNREALEAICSRLTRNGSVAGRPGAARRAG